MEIAKKLCEHGVHVILACRNFEHAGMALETFKHLGYDAEYRHLDISDRACIRQFAEGIEHTYGHLDILVNTAAIAFKAHDHTPFEDQARPTVMTNYFGTLWITQALLPLLRRSAFPRIVNVASDSGHLRLLHSQDLKDAFSSSELTIDKLSNLMESFVESAEAGRAETEGWPHTSYGTSKLAVIALTQVLAREEPGILINACSHGHSSSETGIQDHSRTPVYLATLPENGITGKFLSDENDITASW